MNSQSSLIRKAKALGVTYGESSLLANPRWKYKDRFLMGAENLSEVFDWASGVAEESGDKKAARKLEKLNFAALDLEISED